MWDEVQKIVGRLSGDVESWAKGAKGTVQKKALRDAFTMVDPDAGPAIAKHHKLVELDFDALFPRQTLPEHEPDELKALLGLNPSGKGKVIEYEADSALRDLAVVLTEEFGRGFSRANLQNMHKFYLTYADRLPEKCQTASGKSEDMAFPQIWLATAAGFIPPPSS